MKEQTKIVERKYHWVQCPHCGKYMESEYAKQLNGNYKSHIDSCRANPRKKEVKDEQ